MMNYMITCFATELFLQVVEYLQSSQRLGPPPLPLSLPHPRTNLISCSPTQPTTITTTDVCCNPVAPFTVDTWRHHLDWNSAPLQIRASATCLCVFFMCECKSEKELKCGFLSTLPRALVVAFVALAMKAFPTAGGIWRGGDTPELLRFRLGPVALRQACSRWDATLTAV